MGLNIFYFGQNFAEFFDLLKHFVIWLQGGYCTPERLTHWRFILWGDWLTGVFFSGEIDKLGYYALGRLTHRSIRLRGDWLTGLIYFREIEPLGISTISQPVPALNFKGDESILNCQNTDLNVELQKDSHLYWILPTYRTLERGVYCIVSGGLRTWSFIMVYHDFCALVSRFHRIISSVQNWFCIKS